MNSSLLLVASPFMANIGSECSTPLYKFLGTRGMISTTELNTSQSSTLEDVKSCCLKTSGPETELAGTHSTSKLQGFATTEG